MPRWRQAKESVIWLGLLMPLVLYGANSLRRPSQTTITNQPLFQGIVYSRQVIHQPRPQTIHIIEIDLTAPGLTPFVTPGYDGTALHPESQKKWETVAQRTSEFVQTHQLQLAINANFFYPFREVTPWNYRPRSGQLVNLAGLSISNGNTVSAAQPDWPALCFMQQQAVIHRGGDCQNGTQQAVAGILMLVENGQPTEAVQTQIANETPKPYPFNIAALDATGTRLWLVQTDGKQPLHSEGMTLEEVTAFIQELGVDTAVRLDGGGSTTMAISPYSPNPTTETSNSGHTTAPQVLNVPSHAKVPTQERPVANHLGFFARPLEL